MPFQVGDSVIHPTHGIGRITRLVTKRFGEAETLYYEIAIQRSTVWAPVDAGAANGLRRLIIKGELDQYRRILRSQPASLIPDSRQRRLGLLERLKRGSFHDKCEIVRDLTALGWHKTLNEADRTMLQKARQGLCEEWAGADGVPVWEAIEEVEALLQEGRQKFQSK